MARRGCDVLVWAVAAVAALSLSGCPARGRAGPGTTEPPAGTAPACADACPLRVYARRSGVRIGTAAKLQDPARRELQAREFDALTFENEMIFSSVHPAADRYDFTRTDSVVDVAQAAGMELTAAHFLWDPPQLPQVVPDWLRAIDDPDELRAALRAHLAALHERYGGRIARWNVVNEPLANDGSPEAQNHFARVLGPGYVAEAFRLAAEIWPEAQLVLNENLVEYIPPKAGALIGLVRELKAQGVRVDRVGIQAHLFAGDPGWDLLRTTMGRLAEAGVGVDITELDVPNRPYGSDPNGPLDDADVQAARAAGVVRACLDQPACGSITFWGFDDGSTWLDSFMGPGTAPLLFDTELRPKPMYRAVQAELRTGR